MRIIDADELRLGKFVEPQTAWHKGWNDALDAASTQAPTITPDSLVKRGRWVEGGLFNDLAKCSVCGAKYFTFVLLRENKFSFCPSCGALMED